VFGLVGVLSAIIEVLLIPLYLGSHIFPITVLIAIVLNAVLPRLVALTVDWRWAIGLPLALWVITLIVLAYVNTGHGSVLVPGYGDGQYVGLGLFFVGTVAGFLGVVRVLGPAKAASARR
jgi:hypothetical protein